MYAYIIIIDILKLIREQLMGDLDVQHRQASTN